MSSGNTAFYANEPLFNTLVARYVQANAGAFSGSKQTPMLGIEFVFGLEAPPTVRLAGQPGGGNIAFIFDRISLSIYAFQNNQRGELKNTVPVQVLVVGTLGLNGQNVTITGLRASGEGRLDEKAAAMMNETMIPQFQAQVGNIPLPDFSKVVGLPVSLTYLEVDNRQVRVSAQIGGAGDIPAAPTSNPDFPAIIAAISSGVINELAASQFPGANERVGSGGGDWWLEYRASAWASANQPQVQIENGQGRGSINVGAGASAGIQIMGAGWAEPSPSVTTRTPPLDLRLVNLGKSIIVKVSMNGNITIDFGLPGILEKAAQSILSILQPLATLITNGVNSGLDQININAFTLPDTIPGTSYPATLSFAETGFVGNSVQAVIGVG